MTRYGEEDFDLGYIQSGFTDRETQRKEAQSLLDIVNAPTPLKILDIGCGIGTHDIHWAKNGCQVTGIDLSENFIDKAKSSARYEDVEVNFIVGTLDELDTDEHFDVITCIEYFPHGNALQAKLYDLVKKGGWFFFDTRNPKHPNAIARKANSRSWKEQDGKLYLESHEGDVSTDTQTDIWITIDPENETIDERYNIGKVSESKLSSFDTVSGLLDRRFRDVQFMTIEGQLHTDSTEPYWLWCIARK